MEFSIWMWFVSVLPIITLLFLMSYLKMSSRKSALISLGLTIVSALYIFELHYNQLAISMGKGAFLSLYVILIIVGAVILYNIVEMAGGFETIKDFMENLGGNKSLQFLGLSWAFTGFIQGVTGFGVPIAIVGALLIGIGYKPLISITAVLVGHSWAISFGSMGSSFFALQLVTDLEPIRLGVVLASFFFIPVVTTGIAVAHIYGGLEAIKKNIKYIIPMSILMSAFQLGAAAGNFAHIGSLLAGLAGSIYFLTILIRNSDLSFQEAVFYQNEKMSLLTAVFPYIVLISSVLIFQIPFIKNLLPDISYSLSFPGFTTDLGYEVAAEQRYSPISLFSHPIFFLLLSSISGGAIYFYKKQLTKNKVLKIFQNSFKKSSSSAANVFLLLILALIMNDSGMIFNFAKGVANISGMFFPILSPVIGILGAFLTGSNTSSNVLFGAFQVNTANLLNFQPEVIASTQSVGGSLGSAIAPAKIILGTAVVGIKGKEGEIIKRAIGYTLASGLLVGLAAFIITLFN